MNPRPADYKSAALPTELHQLEANDRYDNKCSGLCQEILLINVNGVLLKYNRLCLLMLCFVFINLFEILICFTFIIYTIFANN